MQRDENVRVEELRAYVASPTARGCVSFEDARALLAVIDAARAEVRRLDAEHDRAIAKLVAGRDEARRAATREADRLGAERDELRRRIETMPPWPRDGEPLVDEQMRALLMRWSTGPEAYQGDADALIATVFHWRAEAERLHALINTPQSDDFFAAVRIEAAHQRERWGEEHDARKTPEDWFWVVGYLAGKAIRPAEPEKMLHRIVALGAVALNWHRQVSEASG